jgi:hypothetical protein
MVHALLADMTAVEAAILGMPGKRWAAPVTVTISKPVHSRMNREKRIKSGL